MSNTYFYETEIGKIGITENGSGITNLTFGDGGILSGSVIKETALLAEAAKQLKEYLAGKRIAFELNLLPEGTPFQQKVWQVLRTIPYGETFTYKQTAEAAGNPKACRAVGMANNKNPLAIFIPCHRVIGSNGKLVGYGGGLNVKEKLLQLEERNRPRKDADRRNHGELGKKINS